MLFNHLYDLVTFLEVTISDFAIYNFRSHNLAKWTKWELLNFLNKAGHLLRKNTFNIDIVNMLFYPACTQSSPDVMFYIVIHSLWWQKLWIVILVAETLLSKELIKLVIVCICQNPRIVMLLCIELKLKDQLWSNALKKRVWGIKNHLHFFGIYHLLQGNATQWNHHQGAEWKRNHQQPNLHIMLELSCSQS